MTKKNSPRSTDADEGLTSDDVASGRRRAAMKRHFIGLQKFDNGNEWIERERSSLQQLGAFKRIRLEYSCIKNKENRFSVAGKRELKDFRSRLMQEPCRHVGRPSPLRYIDARYMRQAAAKVLPSTTTRRRI